MLAAVGLRWWVMENPSSARACERGWGRVRGIKHPSPTRICKQGGWGRRWDVVVVKNKNKKFIFISKKHVPMGPNDGRCVVRALFHLRGPALACVGLRFGCCGPTLAVLGLRWLLWAVVGCCGPSLVAVDLRSPALAAVGLRWPSLALVGCCGPSLWPSWASSGPRVGMWMWVW